MNRVEKYFKPGSLTWWSSVAPILVGLFMAFEPVHGLTAWTQSLGEIFGNASPAVLINAGLAGIGLRGAWPDA